MRKGSKKSGHQYEKPMPTIDPIQWVDPKPGFIYLIEADGRDLAKIGYTTNLRRRLRQLQTGNPYLLRVEFVIAARPETERYIHGVFAECKLEGEWFTGVEALEEFFCDLETQFADNQLAEMFCDGDDPTLLPADIEGVVEWRRP